ncbi:hypothetical protein FRB91_011860 [Serendipita sp. 411]|nr:hypothetical protein FRB91_011860 [Serendipita sp. 411]
MPTWSSVWHKKGLSFNLKLPTELWAMIIDLVLVGVRHPFLFCEPETFPQYQVLLWNVDTSNKIPFLEDWKRVRAVCEEWKRLAGVKPYVFLKGLGPDIPNATSSVFIHCLENPRLSMERITHLKENLTTLALGFSTPAGNDATDILLDNPSMFPNLKCLSVGSSRTKRSFWKVIQDKFPNLISLTLGCGTRIHHGARSPTRIVYRTYTAIDRDEAGCLVFHLPQHCRVRMPDAYGTPTSSSSALPSSSTSPTHFRSQLTETRTSHSRN